MKLINAAILSLAVSLAAASSNLRASSEDKPVGASSPDVPTGAAPSESRQLTSRVDRGEPSYLEFKNGGCVGFQRERSGEEAVVVDCHDDDAAYVAYRDDYLLELYRNNYCLKAKSSSVVLDECDDDDEYQQWYIVSQKIKRNGSYKTYYRICNWQTKYCMEKDRYDVDLEKLDKYDSDQLFKLDRDFFDFD
jgi:hypothetical protein